MKIKRLWSIIFGIVILIVSTYFIFGIFLEKRIKIYIEKIGQNYEFDLKLVAYDRHIFSSSALIQIILAENQTFILHQSLDYFGKYPENLRITLRLDAKHGPLPIYSSMFDNRPLFKAGVLELQRKIPEDKIFHNKNSIIDFNNLSVMAIINLNGDGKLIINSPNQSIVNKFENGEPFSVEVERFFISNEFNSQLNNIHSQLFFPEIKIIVNNIFFRCKGANLKSFIKEIKENHLFSSISFENKNFEFGLVQDESTRIVGNNIEGLAKLQTQKSDSNLSFSIKSKQIKTPFNHIDSFLLSGHVVGPSLNWVMKFSDLIQNSYSTSPNLSSSYKQLDEIEIDNIDISINALQFYINQDIYAGNLKFNFKELPLNFRSATGNFLNNAKGVCNLSFPSSQLIKIIKGTVEKNFKRKGGKITNTIPINELIKKMVQQRITSFEQKGILLKDGGNYIIKAKWQHGQLTVNEHNFSIKDLF